MREMFTIEAIKETATYKELLSKKDHFKISLLEKRDARERITHAFHVWKNTGQIPTTVRNCEYQMVNDFIAMQEIDRSIGMSSEDIFLT